MPTKPRPHYQTCPACRELVEAALDELRAGSRQILRLAASPNNGRTDDEIEEAIAARAITVAAAFLALDAAMNDADDDHADTINTVAGALARARAGTGTPPTGN